MCTKPPQVSPGEYPGPAPRETEIEEKEPTGTRNWIYGIPDVLEGVASGYIKSQKHLEATVTSPNEQKQAKFIRNHPTFLV